ncbi:MAG: ribosome biogenesis GTPase Der [Oligoflexales bacterium]|nr:ribosome biogenesis GTPase Der [Oligoflexales bacterium]
MIRGTVAIVGRPNVGKSTLFNRLTHSSRSLVGEKPGITRDRIYGIVDPFDDNPGFLLVDTGGFETKDTYYQPFSKNIVWEQTELAVQESDVVLLVFDGKDGLHPYDSRLVKYLKKANKRVIYLVNKVDGAEKQKDIWEFYELGPTSDLIPCSAAHNRGIHTVLSAINQNLEECNLSDHHLKESGAVKMALVGRPNAGKSSILNKICGENRALVSEVAGTTRDAVDSRITYNKRQYILIDTAGIRRRSRIGDRLENLCVMRSYEAMERADVVVLVISALEGISDQDARIASYAASLCKPILIVINKWDLIPDKDSYSAKLYEEGIRSKISDISYAPIIFTSCTRNQRVHSIMGSVEQLSDLSARRVSTSDINEVLGNAVRKHTPQVIRQFNKRAKFYYATQVKVNPPTIVVMCNIADEIQESYKRYLSNQFREELGFGRIPLNIIFRGKKEQNERSHSFHEYVEDV